MEDKNVLDNYLKYRLSSEKDIDFNYLKNIFEIANSKISESNSNDLIIYQSEIIEYIIGEIKSNLVHDKTKIALNALESFKLNYSSEESEISIYNVYLTKYLNLISILKRINKNTVYLNPEISLINDLFESVFDHLKAFATLISSSLYSSSLASWRSLHESECVLKVLLQNNLIKKAYVEHIKYDNYLRNQAIYSKEELDENFMKIKEEMSSHNLKSKDMKKFIEYGYLYYASNYDKDDMDFKLNFRDGLEKLAGLSNYASVYEGASQVVHSSPSYFYTNEDFCKEISLCLTYHSVIRITNLYIIYMKNYFDKNKEDLDYVKHLLSEVVNLSKHLDKKFNIEKYL